MDLPLIVQMNVSGTPTKKAKLVSYIDPDAGLSDDDRQSGNEKVMMTRLKMMLDV